ncbi:MAG UNVERIFIED_CONTAM: hypothetical protein LVT10_06370 [Anaerolineae bacterium]
MTQSGVIAEFVKVGGTMMNEPCPYRVIIDRISHEVPYYRSYLENAAIQGVKLVNDPFMWTADDKFFGHLRSNRLGLPSPKQWCYPIVNMCRASNTMRACAIAALSNGLERHCGARGRFPMCAEGCTPGEVGVMFT